MSQSSMRVPSPQEELRRLQTDLNGPDIPARLRAARRICEIGCASPVDSPERTRAIGIMAARLGVERDSEVRQGLEGMLANLRGTPARETASQPETARQGIVGRAAEAAVSRALGPLAVVPRLAGCAVTEYEGSVMSGETGLVRDFTEELVRGETTIEGRVRRVVEWGQANLPHFHGEYDERSAYGENEQNTENVSIRDVFRERVVGCHHAVFTLVTMLRSIGVDAEYVRSESLGLEGEEAGHGILYIPQIDRYVHGDSVCITNLLPTENIIVDRETVSSIVRAQIEARGASSGGFLRRDGNSLFIEGGVVHAGHEDTEFPRLQAMFPEFEITPGPVRSDGLGTTFTTRHVPIVPLE